MACSDYSSDTNLNAPDFKRQAARNIIHASSSQMAQEGAFSNQLLLDWMNWDDAGGPRMECGRMTTEPFGESYGASNPVMAGPCDGNR